MIPLNRLVLYLTDDTLYLYRVTSRRTTFVDSFSWDLSNIEEVVIEVVKSLKPSDAIILNDCVDQHYRKDKVVRAGGGGGVAKRKLNMAFPEYPFRASRKLSEANKKDSGRLKHDIFLFVASPKNAILDIALNIVEKSEVYFSGFGLLPIECTDMVHTLRQKLEGTHKKSKSLVVADEQEKKGARGANKGANKWTVFLGQNKNGGLRQIVVKNKELALTRVTPITDEAADHQRWGQELAIELNATMSYMGRFGYRSGESLKIIIIANPGVQDRFQDIDIDADFHFLSSHQVGGLLGIKADYDSDSHIDFVVNGWVGKKPFLSLPLQSKEIEKFTLPRQIALAASVVLMVGASFLAFKALESFVAIQKNQQTSKIVAQQENKISIINDIELKKKEELGVDIKLIQSTLNVVEKYKSERLPVLWFARQVSVALGPDLRLEDMDIEFQDVQSLPTFQFFEESENGAEEGIEVQRQAIDVMDGGAFRATLRLEFDPNTNVRRGNEQVNDFKDRLEDRLQVFNVKVEKNLQDLNFTGQIKEEFTLNPAQRDQGQGNQPLEAILKVSPKG